MYLSLPGTEKESIQVIPKFQIGKLERSDYQTVRQPVVWNGHSVNDSFSKHVLSTYHALATVRDSRDGAMHQICDLIFTTISGSGTLLKIWWKCWTTTTPPPQKILCPHTCDFMCLCPPQRPPMDFLGGPWIPSSESLLYSSKWEKKDAMSYLCYYNYVTPWSLTPDQGFPSPYCRICRLCHLNIGS